MSRLGRDSRPVTRIQILRRWVLNHLDSVRHERRVSTIARRLVQATLPLHNLEARDRRLLRMAALVHDVGRHVSEKDHPFIGAEMLLEDESLPLKNRHRRALAYLTLYHRGDVPKVGEDVVLRRTDDAVRIRLLLAFLRAADGLDCRSLPSPKLQISRRGRRVRIICRLSEDSAKARRVFARRKKFRLLEEMLDCHVSVVVIVSRKFKLAA
jgi:exopolyphosphatase / guanosine-5'-triphosphate,3'-diphosphate pyrophosphatase